MTVFYADPKNIEKAAVLVKSGGVVAFPTETVYGLGADAFNALAVARIFEIKNRPHFDPLIVHIGEAADLERLVLVPALAKRLTDLFWPGPLTVVLKKKKGIPDLVVSGLSTVAVRMPAHPVALALIRGAQTPIAAPSANPFGYLSPTTAEHVHQQLGDKVEIVLDGGPCMTGVESTIIDLSQAKPRLLRPGGIPIEEIEKITGPLEKMFATSRPMAPGQLEQHYSPRKPLRLLQRAQIKNFPNLEKTSVLLFSGKAQLNETQPNMPIAKVPCAVEVLSVKGDLREAAANLFSALHRLDTSSAELILAEPVPETGLGLAIMDRLLRASAG